MDKEDHLENLLSSRILKESKISRGKKDRKIGQQTAEATMPEKGVSVSKTGLAANKCTVVPESISER